MPDKAPWNLQSDEAQQLLELFVGLWQTQYVIVQALSDQGILDKQPVVDALRFHRASREAPGQESMLFAPVVFLADALELEDPDLLRNLV